MYKNIDNIHIVGKYKMYLYELYLTTMNVYCVYTAMPCGQQQQNSHKKVKAMTNCV